MDDASLRTTGLDPPPAEIVSGGEDRVRPRTPSWVWEALFVVALLVGAYFRFVGVGWDEAQYLHPDERFLIMVESSIEPVESVAEYFDTANSSLNPHNRGHGFFVYGTWPIFIVRYLAEWAGETGYGEIYRVGRPLSALADLGTVLLVFLIGARLFGRRVGLLGAAFYAFAVLPIQLSHFFKEDTFMTFFTVLALYFAVRVLTGEGADDSELVQQDHAAEGVPPDAGFHRSRWAFLLFGLALGMAVASKLNAAPVALTLPVAVGVRLARIPPRAWRRAALQAAGYLVLAALVSALTFRVLQPYAFQGPGFFDLSINRAWLDNIRALRSQASPDSIFSFPPSLQWAERPLSFSWVNMVLWGFGLPLGLLATFGFLWAGWRILSGAWGRHLVLWIWAALYFAWQASAFNPTMRYLLPVYPVLAVFAAWALARLVAVGYRRLGIALTAIVLIATLGWAFAFSRIYTRPVTRIAASRWIFENVPGAINLEFQTSQGPSRQLLSFPQSAVLSAGEPLSLPFVAAETGAVEGVFLPNVIDRAGAAGQTVLLLTVAPDESGETALGTTTAPADLGPGTDPDGKKHALRLDPPVPLEAGRPYYLTVELAGGGEEVNFCGPLNLLVQTADGRQVEYAIPAPHACTARPGSPLELTFSVPEPGGLQEVTLSQIFESRADPDPETLEVRLTRSSEAENLLGSARVIADFPPQRSESEGYWLGFDAPIPLTAGETYQLELALAEGDGALALEGAALTNETSWDDSLPLRIDGYDPFGGIYKGGLNFEMYWDDNEEKVDRFIDTLNTADYVLITSSRQWGSVGRLPDRYPLSNAFYRALAGCPEERDVEWCYNVAQPGTFDERSGYELVRVFESRPSIGPIEINDQFAEEAFTVYDHPKVFVFRKTEAYDPESVATFFQRTFAQVEAVAVEEAGQVEKDLLLPPERLESQREGGTWAALFDSGSPLNRFQPLGTAVWYLAIFLIGLVAYPVVREAFPGLEDRGYPLARMVGLISLSYLVWIAGSFEVPFTRMTITGMLLVLAAVGGAFAWWRREELRVDWVKRRRYFLFVEALFLAFFLVGLFIRLGNPDLWHPWKGGEKPMDFSYFNAVLKSTSFPPYDPWFAGGYINYYYYGFVLTGVPVKWLGILPSIAYNLILPTLFALMAAGAFSLGWNLTAPWRGARPISSDPDPPAPGPVEGVGPESPAAPPDLPGRRVSRWTLYPGFRWRRLWGGLSAALGMVVLGNLGTLRMILRGYRQLASPGGASGNLIGRTVAAVEGFFQSLTGSPLPYALADWYWNPSRVIDLSTGNPITEFPFFTLLYADLHAHLIALPVTLLVLAWGLSVVTSRGRWRNVVGLAAGFLIGGLAVGALRPTNTWDFYPYLALGSLAVGYAAFRYAPLRARGRLWDLALRLVVAALGVGALVALGHLLYRPFGIWYAQGYSEIEIWRDGRTPLGDYLVHWGVFLFVIVSWMVWETREWLADTPLSALRKLEPYRPLIYGGVVLALTWVAVLLWMGVHIGWVVLPLAVWAGILILRPGMPDRKRFVLFLTGTALTLTLMVEVIVLRGDIGRMNTVFKFYLQAWTLLAVSAAGALGWLVAALPRWLPGWRRAWQVVVVALVGAAALYPLVGGLAKIQDRMAEEAPHTLNGMTYMAYATYDDLNTNLDLGEDYEAIRWMQENVSGSPVIVEANSLDLYHWFSRYTINTGLPGVVGWDWHQRQQRAFVPSSNVTERVHEIEAFYRTQDPAEARAFLEKYDVRYIVLGQLERAKYPGPGLEKFPALEGQLWEAVYRDGSTVIYRVRETPEGFASEGVGR